jgi:hypothetical protein
MPRWTDGPASPHFTPWRWTEAPPSPDPVIDGVHARARAALATAPSGHSICRGLPFELPVRPWVTAAEMLVWRGAALRANWLVFQHACEWPDPDTHIYPNRAMPRGGGGLNDLLATYVLIDANGGETRLPVRRRHQVGLWEPSFGDGVTQALTARKPLLLATDPQDRVRFGDFGLYTTGAANSHHVNGGCEWINWLWAWPNPDPAREFVGLRIEPAPGAEAALFFFGVSAGSVDTHPLQWGARRSLRLPRPAGIELRSMTRRSTGEDAPEAEPLPLDLDLGQVLRVFSPATYPNERWAASVPGSLPTNDEAHLIVEYIAHPQARLFAFGIETELPGAVSLLPLPTQRVRLRIVERGRGLPVAARLHLHDSAGQSLVPEGHRRASDMHWAQDLHADLSWRGRHHATYVPGEAVVNVPSGALYVEVSKGFEFAPVRRVFEIDAHTTEIVIELERGLDWRARGWSTADTHVHFISPGTGLLEGAAEDVHLVHLLAAQWGEMFSNTGDFDGGALHRFQGAAGDDAHHLVVGTENRQRVLGHISLLAYGGAMITPMSSAGSDEATLGQPQEATLVSWAEQCRAQGGVVILPHFPNPRLENAAVLAAGLADGVEMGGPFGAYEPQIDPYALADWYRYLNCGLHSPVVGGTDKMSPADAIGAIRTYVKLADVKLTRGEPFSLAVWRAALQQGRSFVSVGALLEFEVEGQTMGARFAVPVGGATLTVQWEAATLGRALTQVDLLRNGEVIESTRVDAAGAAGQWSVRIERSSWLALRVRAQGESFEQDGREIISAHSSPVTLDAPGSAHGAEIDALTILEQIEGAIAWMDTLATPVDAQRHRAMRLKLAAIHREFHQRMHAAGLFHQHAGPHHHAHDHHDHD